MGVKAFNKADLLNRLGGWAQENGQNSNVTIGIETIIEALEQWEEHDQGLKELARKLEQARFAGLSVAGERDQLMAEIEDTKGRLELAERDRDAIRQNAAKLEEEVARLRKALEWYANGENYTDNGAVGITHREPNKEGRIIHWFVPDRGTRARAALEGKE